MTDLIVHIGDAKCGSTSIQQGLFLARSSLRESGLAYCVNARVKSHADLLMLAGEKTHYSSRDPETVSRAKEKINAIRKSCRKCDYVILSAESLFAFGPASLKRLIEIIGVNFDNIHIACYIRPPAEKYLSLVQQLLKTRANFQKPDKFRSRIAQGIKAWRSDFGAENFYIRKFDRAHLREGDITRDFWDFLEDCTQRSLSGLSVINANRSLSAEQIYLLQELRMVSEPGKLSQTEARSRKIITLFNRMNRDGLVGTKLSLSEEARTCLEHRNFRDSEYLYQEFSDLGFAAPGRKTELLPAEAPWTSDESVFGILEAHRTDIVDLLRLIAFTDDADLAHQGEESIRPRVAQGLARLWPERQAELLDVISEYWKDIGALGDLSDIRA